MIEVYQISLLWTRFFCYILEKFCVSVSNKKLTIIIPCFNSYLAVSNLLVKIYAVVKCQTKILELLIIDDFSNEYNLNLRDSLSKKFIDVYFLDNEYKRGVGGARNTGILRSQGEYLYFADSDDLFDIKGIRRI